MAITLQVTTEISNNMWKLTFHVNSDGSIPTDVFIYENTGAVGSGIGEFQGICSLDDYNRLQTHVPGVNIPIFGNKFVKYSLGTKFLPIDSVPKTFSDRLVADLKAFKTAFLIGASTTTNVTI